MRNQIECNLMNLLLVDDEAFALEALEHAINWKSLGIDQVFTCGNIKAARQICQESDIQIMICDIEMPNGTGLDLAKWLSENYPDLLILFLTCHSDFSFCKRGHLLPCVCLSLKNRLISKRSARQ